MAADLADTIELGGGHWILLHWQVRVVSVDDEIWTVPVDRQSAVTITLVTLISWHSHAIALTLLVVSVVLIICECAGKTLEDLRIAAAWGFTLESLHLGKLVIVVFALRKEIALFDCGRGARFTQHERAAWSIVELKLPIRARIDI